LSCGWCCYSPPLTDFSAGFSDQRGGIEMAKITWHGKPTSYDLNQVLDDLLPQLDLVINKALPNDELRRLFDDYLFLTLFHNCRVYTNAGKKAVRSSIQRAYIYINHLGGTK
jgi:hypothetical protein